MGLCVLQRVNVEGLRWHNARQFVLFDSSVSFKVSYPCLKLSYVLFKKKNVFICHIVNANLYHVYSLFLSVLMNKALFFSCQYGGYGCNNTV